jgi:hypothetical protein
MICSMFINIKLFVYNKQKNNTFAKFYSIPMENLVKHGKFAK